MSQNDSVKISLIGDVFPAELPYTVDYGIKTQFRKHQGIPWQKNIKEILGENDLTIGNLESPLISEKNAAKKTFYGTPDFAPFLKENNINVLNLANNHILEHGSKGFYNTVDKLQSLNLDIIGNIIDSQSNIVYKEINGIRIAIAGFSNVDLETIKNDNCFAVLNEKNVTRALESMKEFDADYKILCFHWGNEYINIPSLQQRKMAYTFIDKGADIIVGHHPHVIQPYEKYKNGHVFYSLGNFMFDFLHSKVVRTGLAVTINLNKNKIAYINLIGIKLSYKNTLNLMPAKKFKNHFAKIEELYDKFIVLNDDDYQKHYYALLKKNHTWQRVIMKVSILLEFLRIRLKDKKFLIRNVIIYYLQLFK